MKGLSYTNKIVLNKNDSPSCPCASLISCIPTKPKATNLQSTSQYSTLSLYSSISGDSENEQAPMEDFKWIAPVQDPIIVHPYDMITDFNLETNSVVFECELSRQLGIEIIQEESLERAVVGEVYRDSRAESLGLRKGDVIVATSATAGDQMWMHNSAEGVKSALGTRFVMSSSVRIRFERALEGVDAEVRERLKVPYHYSVKVKRPIGLHVLEGPNKAVYVQHIKPDLGAARSKMIEIGDQVEAMSASWGDRLWEVNSVESFVVGVRMRTDSQLTFRMRRMVPLNSFISILEAKRAKLLSGKSLIRGPLTPTDALFYDKAQEGMSPSTGINGLKGQPGSRDERYILNSATFLDAIDHAKNSSILESLWLRYNRGEVADGFRMDSYCANKLMTRALQLERPLLAVQIFEHTFGFRPEINPAQSIIQALQGNSGRERELTDEETAEFLGLRSKKPSSSSIPESDNESSNRAVTEVHLLPNNFVCTTAIKAYGRVGKADRALSVLPWMEKSSPNTVADIYLLSALLYVCAKNKQITQAERIFWKEIPKRGLSYTIATTNSLMYMYARLNRADDALKVYELTKSLGIKCTVITFGVLIKALMNSGKKQLEDTSYEILRSLPGMGIIPGIEVYNQFLEHYAKTHNYRQTKNILRLMAQSKPRVKPDVVSYGYLISCFADAKKPKSALTVFHQMRSRGIAANSYTYMGVLKALMHRRDGLTAVQVITEMREVGVKPDKRHFAMAMFACVLSGVNNLAESLLALHVRLGEKPDTVLYTLLLRAMIQQGKWAEGYALVRNMAAGPVQARPNLSTLNYLLQAQVSGERWAEALDTLSLVLTCLRQPGQTFTAEAEVEVEVEIGSTRPKDRIEQAIRGGVTVGSGRDDFVNPSITGPQLSSQGSLGVKFISPKLIRRDQMSSSAVLSGTFSALSFALGLYSSEMQRIQRDDNSHQQRAWAVASQSASGPSSGQAFGNDLAGASDPERLDQFGFYSPGQQLTKPTAEALEFLVDCTEIICTEGNTILLGNFYIELLQAVAIEGTAEQIYRLLDLGKSRSIKVKVKAEDMQRLETAEELARRSVAGKRMTSPKAPPSMDLPGMPKVPLSIKGKRPNV